MSDWIDAEITRINAERKAFLVEKGFDKEAVAIGQGATELEVDRSEPPKNFVDKKSGRTKYVFQLKSHPNNVYIVPGIVYEQILKVLATKKDGKLKITRKGTTKEDTRYVVQ